MDRASKAVELKHSGCNCAQAVLLAFEDMSGLYADTLKKLGAGFGVGMGCLNATCGALCAAQMLQGLIKYRGAPILADAKMLNKGFEQLCGATECADLKGVKTGRVLCECDDCVRNAVRSLEIIIEE